MTKDPYCEVYKAVFARAENPPPKRFAQSAWLSTLTLLSPRSVRRNTVLKTQPDRTETSVRSGTRLLLVGLAISEGEPEPEIGLYKVFY
jgi:hypothetical protein